MKKKVFSKLLMVALVATVGAFTSCKDYDDDINDLRSKVDGLNTSLTTLVNDKVTTVSAQVNNLEQQLSKVEDAYKTADAALQKELDAAKETGKANTDAIKVLQEELVNLYATKASLADAKKALEDALEKANAAIKANGDEIIKLVAADKALEDKIGTAQTAANNALAEAQKALNKANENASEISSLKTKEQADFDNLQKQISDNLTDVNAKIEGVKKTLEDYIKTNNTEISNLKTDVTTNKTEIKNIKDKLTELEKTDTEIYAAIKAAQDKLEKADADAAAAQKEINDAQKAKNEELLTLIQANEAAIKTLNETTLPQLKEDLINHTIPAEVTKQLNLVLTYRLKKFFDEDVTTLVNGKFEEGVTLIDALEDKVDSIDEAINKTMLAQFVIAVALIDSIADAHDTKASDLADAYKTADNLVKDSIGKVAAALESAKTTLGNKLTTLDEQINGKGEAKGIVGQIDALEEWFELAEGQEEGGLLKYQEALLNAQAVKDAVKSIVEAVNGELYTMITSINLFANQHDAAYDNSAWYTGFDHTLTFTYTIEKGTVKFPADENITDKQFSFTKGMFRSYCDSILVRVSPTNADLAAAWQAGNIALLNSQGGDIVAQNIIEVDSVARFNRLLTATRSTAAGNETGLWVIYFKIKDSEIGEGFKDAAVAKVNGQDQKILYSIGVKNTTDKEGLKERYVVSEYDLDLSTAPAYPAWDFYVNGKSVRKIHNRYVETDKELVPSDDSIGLAKKTFRHEYTWLGCDKAQAEAPYSNAAIWDAMLKSTDEDIQAYVKMIPATEMILEGENANATDRLNHRTGDAISGVDNRHACEILPVTVGEPISIDFPNLFQFDSDAEAQYNNWYPTPVKGFYVTLDHDFALESKPSEINAWTSYEYENVGVFKKDKETGETTITKATLIEGNHGTITIKKINNVSGDIIGFRVFAVNLDGTLTDPDGRAFYVKVGKEYDNELSFTVTAETRDKSGAIQDSVNHKNPILAQNELFAADETGDVDPFFNVDNHKNDYTWQLTWADNNPQICIDGKLYTPAAGSQGILGYFENVNIIDQLFEFSNTTEKKASYEDGSIWTKMQTFNGIIGDNDDVPTWETNNMAVRIKDALALQDSVPYYLWLTIREGDGRDSYGVVSKTLIKVTKVLPAGLPKGFKVKTTLDVFSDKMKFYLRPLNETATWSIASWFDEDEDDFGASALTAGEAQAPSNQWIPWYGKPGTEAVIGQGGQILPTIQPVPSRMTRANSQALASYRWATDVRPYNFEEIFAGLLLDNNQYDVNYKFVFEGCGDYTKDLNGTTADAVSVYRSYADWMDYVGLNPTRTQPTDMHPGYYLPAVFYQVIDKFGSLDKAVSVKVGYTYNNVSLKIVNGQPVAGAKEITPMYFDKDGKKTDKAGAAFKAYFACAIHNTFSTGAGFKVADFYEYDTYGQPSAQTVEIDFAFDSTNKYIPYGVGFTAKLDSIGVVWVSDLPALTVWNDGEKAKGASYFRTNFGTTDVNGTPWGGFTSSYTKGSDLTSNGVSYYTDTLAIKAGQYLNTQNTYLYKLSEGEVDYEKPANWVRIANLKKVEVGEVKLEKWTGTKWEDVTLTAADFAEYFEVEATNDYKLKFAPKTTALDPTKVGQMTIKVQTTADLIHQWGHVSNKPFASKKIYIGKPHSAEHTQGARQSR